MNQDIPIEVKRQILQQKLQIHRQGYYAHQIDAQVAQDIGGMEQVVEQAKENMARAQKFIDKLEELLTAIAAKE